MLTKDVNWKREEDGSHESSRMGHDCGQVEGSIKGDDISMAAAANSSRTSASPTAADANDLVDGGDDDEGGHIGRGRGRGRPRARRHALWWALG